MEKKKIDIEQRRKINKQPLDDMDEVLAGKAFDEIIDVSKIIITAIAQGKIRNISIKY